MSRELTLACLCLLLIGCGRSYDGPQRIPLTGKVTCDGEAVDFGTISFLPESGEQRVSGGEIENGAYSFPEDRGANAGKYRVEIRWSKKTGKQIHDSYLGTMVDERKEGLPSRFNQDSELTVDVVPGQTNYDFNLKTK